MDLGLRGKNAAITGSSQGIGYAIATALAKEGCNVALSARGEQRLSAAVKDMQTHGVKAVGIIADLATEQGCKEFVEGAAKQLGGIDILVNNVGGMIPGTLEGLTSEQWDKVLSVNLMAAVYTTKYALPHVKKGRPGRILNVSGVTGKQLLPGALTTTIPNAAIIAFSKIMAGELGATGVTVNNICPGFTKTESWGPRAEAMAKVRGTTADQVRAGIAGQTLLGRWAEPEEIGNVAAFLVSDKNSYMTGTTVEVCGGFNRYI
ncbi:MAG TPA: SDR family oxidoreductase [Gammaproteobacteria bacterium]|nr:SDR family oxidoreductase [Gammaproteobacteria bacterium]